MKRYCKDVDITNRDFISRAVRKCLCGGKNGKSKLGRNDTLRMFREYSGLPISFLKKIAKDHEYRMFDGIIDTVVDGIRQEILNGKYAWKPIWYTQRCENGKIRRIGIQDIKQQLYDYIAVEGLAEVFQKKIGYYQCAAIPGKGQVVGMRAIKRWLRNKGLRYAWKGDAKHYYENIDTDRLKQFLERYVDNKSLLKLVFALIDSFDKGLSIGSYLSQYLANFYMSFAYHYATENLYKIRKHKDGTQERVNLVSKVLIYMDDILFLGTSLKDLKMAAKRFRKWAWGNLKINIKEDDKYINLQNGYIDMMGCLISRKKVIVRGRIFRRYRRDISATRKTGEIIRTQAKRIISRDGWLDNAQCKRWKKRNKANKIVELCKEMISNGENVIQFTAAGSDDKSAAGRETRRNGTGQRRNRGGKKPIRANRTKKRNDVPVRRKPVPDGVRTDGREDTDRKGKVSGVQHRRRTDVRAVTA